MTSASGTIIDGEAYARLRTGGEAPRLGWSPVAADFLPVGASSETAGPASVIGFEAGDFVNLDDFEKRALDVLPHMARTYYVSGAEDETTLREVRTPRWRCESETGVCMFVCVCVCVCVCLCGMEGE